jgi:colanic acid/amylovoran biosynthesis glycosyltransferase
MNPPLPASERPRVAVFRENLLPSSETFIAAQAGALRRYEARLFGFRYHRNPLVTPEEVSVAFGASTGRLRIALTRAFLLAPAALVRPVSAWRPTLIHAHFGPDAVSAIGLANRLGVPLVPTFHGFDATVSDHHLFRSSFRNRAYLLHRSRLTDRASRIIAVSNFVRGQLIARGVSEHKVRVVYTGVDTDRFTFSPHLPFPDVSVLFVGRIVAKKGLFDLLAAVRALQAHMPVRLTIIGTGECEADAVRAAAEMPRVAFRGALPPEEVRAALGSHRVLCVPSKTAPDGDREGFGMVFAEAQSMGIPVVSYASGGVPEAVAHGVTGLLAREGDVEGLGQALHTLLALGEDEWRAFSHRAAARVRQLFSLSAQASVLEDVYDEARAEYASRR